MREASLWICLQVRSMDGARGRSVESLYSGMTCNSLTREACLEWQREETNLEVPWRHDVCGVCVSGVQDQYCIKSDEEGCGIGAGRSPFAGIRSYFM